MTPRGKFLDHLISMSMLWIPAILAAGTVLLASQPQSVPVLAIAALGLFLIICAKWRLLRDKQYGAFQYGKLTKAEKMFYLAGYFFIAVAFFVATYLYFLASTPS